MKYIIVENKEQTEEELHYDIADFLWNNGNEVYIRDYFAIDFKKILKDCNCIILLVNNVCSSDFFSDEVQKRFKKDVELEGYQNTKTILIFSNTGVYSDAIPFPHKIFQFEQLDQNELIRFFNWSRALHLFDNKVK